MIRLWFRALARKLLPARELQKVARQPGRVLSGLRVEALENRTVTTTVAGEPPPALVPESSTPQMVVLYPETTEPISVDAAPFSPEGSPEAGPGTTLPDASADSAPREAEPPAATDPETCEAFNGKETALGSSSSTGSVGSPQRSVSAVSPSFKVEWAVSPAATLTLAATLAQTTQDAAPGIAMPELLPPAEVELRQVREASPQTPTAVQSLAEKTAGAATGSPQGDAGPRPESKLEAREIRDFRPASVDRSLAAAPAQGGVPSSWQGRNLDGATHAEVKRLPSDLPDGSLLYRFVKNQEQSAFAELVHRHERFVLQVCKRVLGDSHAAEDALQATFLVLARKASMLDREGPLSGWLYKVAFHLALRLRGVAARQRRSERDAAVERPLEVCGDVPPAVEEQELRQALKEELHRLPEKYRTPLELCYLNGQTHEEAARLIGLPRGSMAKRLGQALDRLRERLHDRGFSLEK